MMLLAFIYTVVSHDTNEILIWFCLMVFYVYFFASVRKPLMLTPGIKTFIKIDTFFMLFYYIIYLYPYQLAVLGLKDLSVAVFLDKTYEGYSNMAVAMSIIGLIAFQFGFKSYSAKREKGLIHTISKKYMKALTYLTLFLVIVILVLFAKTGMKSIFLGAYAGSKTGNVTGDAIFSLVTFFIVLAGVQILVYFKLYRKLRVAHVILLLIVSIWTILLLVIGDRNTFFIVGIILIAGVFTYIRSISRKQILLMLFGALTLYQVVEVSRRAENRGLEAIWDAFVNRHDHSSDDELEISSFDITTIGNRAGYKIIQDQENFYYGKFKLISLASIVPYSSRLFVSKSDRITGSSNVLKKEMIGEFASWGTGTNIITDCYMDFGVLGVVIIMFFMGKFGGYVKYKTQNNLNSPKWMFLYLITLGYYSELARYGFDFPLRSIVWTFLIFYFVDRVLKLEKLNGMKISC
jgi:hypothetical protein